MKPSAIEAWSPRLHAVSGRVKVWTREISRRRLQGTRKPEEPTNPIYILAAITLGIPALLMIPLIGMNPGVLDGSFGRILTILVVSAFVTAAVFEIKRLADQPSDADRH
jgi:hypothetical protein